VPLAAQVSLARGDDVVQPAPPEAPEIQASKVWLDRWVRRDREEIQVTRELQDSLELRDWMAFPVSRVAEDDQV